LESVVVSTQPSGGHEVRLASQPQLPDVQTNPVPHEDPSVTSVPVSVQTGLPLEQSTLPSWHGLVGVQLAAALHDTHAPALQTMPVPQLVPFGACDPVSLHVPTLPLQLMMPVSHGFVGTHEAPLVHVVTVHAPLWHVCPVPQDVPLVTGVPVSSQLGVVAAEQPIFPL
jgi:hypothetical protein